ncbi:MAG: hypothetical protein OXI79_19295 [Gammaproteobacteria bacterium]|nr:hypothetical protein [Gammaproteobacteria bacterium]
MSFQAANSAVEADWLSEALGAGEWGHVSGIVPRGFEAYVAVRHPAWRCDCTEENLPVLQSGHERGRPVRWVEVAESDVPVVYGYVLYTKRRITRSRNTLYRRLKDGDWVVDELPGVGLLPVLRPGDAWITGPREGSLQPDLARTLQGVLARATEDSVPCWFGIWEGFGYLTEAQRAAPAVEAPGRRWHLFRAPLDQFERSFGEDWFEHQTANLAWPENRSWCLATEIDAEVTYVGGTKDLISAILDEPGLEAVPARLDERLAGLRDVLTPVVDQPAGVALPPGFESREYPPDRNPLGWKRRLGILMGWMYRLVVWLIPSLRKEHDEMLRSGLFVSTWGLKRRGKSD